MACPSYRVGRPSREAEPMLYRFVLARKRACKTASIPLTRSKMSSFSFSTLRAVVSRSCRSSGVTH
jgi:hypothetical protein